MENTKIDAELEILITEMSQYYISRDKVYPSFKVSNIISSQLKGALDIDAPSGIYFLQLQTENRGVITKKILKE